MKNAQSSKVQPIFSFGGCMSISLNGMSALYPSWRKCSPSFHFCTVSVRIWNKVMSCLGIMGFPTSFSMLDSYSNYEILFVGRVKKEYRMIFWYLVGWCLWLVRNEIMFKGGVLNEKEFIYSVKIRSWNLFGAICNGSNQSSLELWFDNSSFCIN